MTQLDRIEIFLLELVAAHREVLVEKEEQEHRDNMRYGMMLDEDRDKLTQEHKARIAKIRAEGKP